MQVPELLLAGVATTLILLEVLTFDPGEPVLARVLAGAMAGLSLALIRRRPLTGYLINGSAVLALIALGHPSDFYQWTNLMAMIGVATRLPTDLP
ncbi:MAG: hypothetical protein H0V96_07840 [Acidimicrobiia bacterium]|nr:hypothetical protein [Acidimicrobiia bacterium]